MIVSPTACPREFIRRRWLVGVNQNSTIIYTIVDIIDIDFQSPDKLLDYDVVMFIGGNPYYLLMSLRKCNAKSILKEISEKKCLIGWSAGALVLCSTIKIIDEYSPEMNLWGLDDLTGMEIADIQILPHYDKFCDRYERFEERCHEYEAKNHLPGPSSTNFCVKFFKFL